VLLVAEDVVPEVVEVAEVVEVEEGAGDSDIQHVFLAYKFFTFVKMIIISLIL